MSAKVKQKLEKEIQVIFNQKEKTLIIVKNDNPICGFCGPIAEKKYNTYKSLRKRRNRQSQTPGIMK